MSPTTRNLADQLANIAAQLDAILASLRDDVEEIKAQMIEDGCNSEESDNELKNTLAEEPQGSEHDPIQQLRSGIDGVNKIGDVQGIAGEITETNAALGDEIGGADKMGDQIRGVDELALTKSTKLMAPEIKLGGTTKKLTANGSHDQKGRGESGAFIEGVTKSEIGNLSKGSSRVEGEMEEEKFMLSCISENRDAIRIQHKDQIEIGGSFKGSLSGKLPCVKLGKHNILSITGPLLEYFMNSPPLKYWVDNFIDGILPFPLSEVFKWSWKRFVLDHSKRSVADHQWVSAAGYPILELLIAWDITSY